MKKKKPKDGKKLVYKTRKRKWVGVSLEASSFV